MGRRPMSISRAVLGRVVVPFVLHGIMVVTSRFWNFTSDLQISISIFYKCNLELYLLTHIPAGLSVVSAP